MDRIDVVQKTLDKINGKVYLEIGVENGVSFLPISAEIKVGIDILPLNENIKKYFDGKSKIYFQMNSVEFFNNYKDIFEDYKIDVAFIDGFHGYEQSLKDVENCLNYLSKKGVIIMHDCNPPSEIIATPPSLLESARKSPKWNGTWTGDVWKTIVHLRSFRNNLNIFVLNCDWGLGIITKGKSEGILNYSVKDIKKMSYFQLDEDVEELLNLKEPGYFYKLLEKI